MSSEAPSLIETDTSSSVSKTFAIVGFFLVAYGQVSYVAKERLYLSEPLLALVFGIIVGPYVLNFLDPIHWIETTDSTTPVAGGVGGQGERNELTYQLTRLVLGYQVMITGIDLPKKYLKKEALSLVTLLAGIMTTAWFISALLIWGLIRGQGWSLTYLESLCIAAAITPTDPVLASSITKGRFAEESVAPHVRNIILAESGANDGLGFPFLYLAIYLIRRHTEADTVIQGSLGSTIGQWIYAVLLFQIVLSCLYGAIVGYLGRKILKWAEARQYIDEDYFFSFGIGLTLFTLGTTGLFGSDDILACFIAGNALNWDDFYRTRSEENNVQEVVDMLLNFAVFAYIGAILPWDWYSLLRSPVSATDSIQGIDTWRVVVLGILILLLRRPPWVVGFTAARAIPALHNWKESTFAGWFGPIGVGAVFYVEVALESIPDERTRLREIYAPVVFFIVFASVLGHGVTVPLMQLRPLVQKGWKEVQSRRITFTTIPSRRNTKALDKESTFQAHNTVNTTASSSSSSSAESSAQLAARTDAHAQTGSQPQQASPPQDDRPLWNPLWSLWTSILHFALFWRQDSFFRRPPHHDGEVNVEKVVETEETIPAEVAQHGGKGAEPAPPAKMKTIDVHQSKGGEVDAEQKNPAPAQDVNSHQTTTGSTSAAAPRLASPAHQHHDLEQRHVPHEHHHHRFVNGQIVEEGDVGPKPYRLPPEPWQLPQ